MRANDIDVKGICCEQVSPKRIRVNLTKYKELYDSVGDQFSTKIAELDEKLGLNKMGIVYVGNKEYNDLMEKRNKLNKMRSEEQNIITTKLVDAMHSYGKGVTKSFIGVGGKTY